MQPNASMLPTIKSYKKKERERKLQRLEDSSHLSWLIHLFNKSQLQLTCSSITFHTTIQRKEM